MKSCVAWIPQISTFSVIIRLASQFRSFPPDFRDFHYLLFGKFHNFCSFKLVVFVIKAMFSFSIHLFVFSKSSPLYDSICDVHESSNLVEFVGGESWLRHFHLPVLTLFLSSLSHSTRICPWNKLFVNIILCYDIYVLGTLCVLCLRRCSIFYY